MSFVVAPLVNEWDGEKNNTVFPLVFERNEGNKVYTTQPLFDFATREECQTAADALNTFILPYEKPNEPVKPVKEK